MRILVLDVETAPNIAYVWGAWKQNVGVKQFISPSYLMSFAAKWLHEDKVIYCENRRKKDEAALLEQLVSLMDEADVIIAHNAKKFDIPTIQGRAALLGLKPPSPFKVIDTLLSAKKHFRLPMNSLAYLTEAFNCTVKKKTHEKFPGFELWLECLKQNDEAWEEMKVYNIDDVISLEELYLKMRPWIYPHPNFGNYDESEKSCCPRCGSKNVHYRGYYHTQVMKYRRYRCMDCGGWGKERFTARERGVKKEMLVGV